MRNPETEAFHPVSPKDVLLVQCRFKELFEEGMDDSRITTTLIMEFPKAYTTWREYSSYIEEFIKRHPEEWESFVNNNGSGNNHQGKNKE